MNKMKSLILALTVALLAVSAKAETYSTSIAVGTNILKGSQSIYIASALLANGTGSAVTIELFDAPTNTLTYTVGAYTNTLSYVSNIVSTVVGITGHTNTFTNSTLVTVANSVVANTNNYRSILKATIPANASLTIPLETIAAYGVLATNNGTIGVTLQYQRLLTQ
jgi:hypothetical protein